MKPRFIGIVLVLVVGQGFLSAGLRGMEPGFAPVITEPIPGAQPTVTEWPAGFEAAANPEPPHVGMAPDQSPTKRRRRHCWATHNSLGCSSLKAECTFIFGSCRAFYGEECLQGPPPLPLPPGYPTAAPGCSTCP